VYRGLDVLSHGGHSGGFRSTFWRFPGQRFAVVLLSNDEHFAQLQNAEAIIDFCLRGALKPKQADTPMAAARPNSVEPNRNLSDFEGSYFNAEIDASYQAKVRNGKLSLIHLRHGEIALLDAGQDSFTGRIEFPVQCRFLRDASGKVIELRISNFGAKNVKFRRAPH